MTNRIEICDSGNDMNACYVGEVVMKKNIIISMIYFSFCISLPILSNEQLYDAHDTVSVSVSFDHNLYPISPVQECRATAMQLWSDINKASLSSQVQLQFNEHINIYVEKFLDLYALFYSLIQKKLLDNDEVLSLYKLVYDMEYRFDKVMIDCRNDKLSCCKIVLEKIQKKLEQMLAL